MSAWTGASSAETIRCVLILEEATSASTRLAQLPTREEEAQGE